MRRSICLILSALFLALAIPQSVSPLSRIVLSNSPQAAVLFQSILRHSVEEVSTKPLDSARAESIEFASLDGVVEQDSATAPVEEIKATDWRSQRLFHRRIAPSSTDDGN
jgi:hypothetical protein